MANEEFFAEANAAIKACDKEKAIAAAKRGEPQASARRVAEEGFSSASRRWEPSSAARSSFQAVWQPTP
jgi:hypothetical protein